MYVSDWYPISILNPIDENISSAAYTNEYINENRLKEKKRATVQELVDLYASVHNKFWYIEDDLYDYEKGSEEYEQFCSVVDAWGCMMDDLKQRVITAAKNESLLPESKSGQGKLKQIELLMQKYGYRDGLGWWVLLTNRRNNVQL